jgi:hypothetical protein
MSEWQDEQKRPSLDEMLSGMTEANRHDEFPSMPVGAVLMPRELTDEQADAALRATAAWLDVKGSQLTVNREKMKARYRSLVKFIERTK